MTVRDEGDRRHRALASPHIRFGPGPGLRVVAEGSAAGAQRFAVDAYVHFVREKTLLEAVASCLTELFSPVIIGERWRACSLGMISSPGTRSPYFDKRPPQASRDADYALDYVKRNAKTRAEQDLVIGALAFKCGCYYGRCWTR